MYAYVFMTVRICLMVSGEHYDYIKQGGNYRRRYMMADNEFMNYMGYRYTAVENKVEECLSAARRGETSVTIDADDLTDSEVEYLKKELERRLNNGSY